MATKPSLRLQFLGAELEHLPDERFRVRVRLGRRLTEDLDQTYIGKAEASWSVADELRCAVHATLEAVSRAFKAQDDAFELAGVKSVDGFDGAVVLVKIRARHADEEFELLGIGEVKDQPATAAAMAALFATNRFVTFAFRGN